MLNLVQPCPEDTPRGSASHPDWVREMVGAWIDGEAHFKSNGATLERLVGSGNIDLANEIHADLTAKRPALRLIRGGRK